MTVCRLLLDPPAAGSWNMAVDEALLMAAAREGEPTLRFYSWREATLSLGYFQRHDQRHAHAASLACPLVRRASGGGAILHHYELTYSFVAPLTDRLSATAEDLYYLFHDTLIDTLRVFGVDARLCESSVVHPRGQEPFLCFQRRSKGDILCGEAKITGSAQRRHQGAVLQHGSILLVQSPFAPELPAAAELSGRVLAIPELIAAWSPWLSRRLGVELEPSELSTELQTAAVDIEQTKFAAAQWTERR